MYGCGNGGQHLVNHQTVGVDRHIHGDRLGHGSSGKPEGVQRNCHAALRVGKGGNQTENGGLTRGRRRSSTTSS